MFLRRRTVKHYDRMIKWAETQKPTARHYDYIMLKELGVNWGALYCPYCKQYGLFYGVEKCRKCPLMGDMNDDNPSCCSGLWSNMQMSMNWAQWVDHAGRVRNYIKNKEWKKEKTWTIKTLCKKH